MYEIEYWTEGYELETFNGISIVLGPSGLAAYQGDYQSCVFWLIENGHSVRQTR